MDRTRIAPPTSNPNYNELFQYRLTDIGGRIKLEVYDYYEGILALGSWAFCVRFDLGLKDKIIGDSAVDLSTVLNWNEANATTLTVPLKSRLGLPAGSVVIAVEWIPSASGISTPSETAPPAATMGETTPPAVSTAPSETRPPSRSGAIYRAFRVRGATPQGIERVSSEAQEWANEACTPN